MPLHPTVAKVTDRIIARSATTRTAYLDLIARARDAGVNRDVLSCGNLAHGFAAAGEDKAAYPDPAPHLLALAPLPGLRWEMLPPADFVEYSANAACPPVHAGACWGGDTRAAAAVHFTCLDRAVKLRNMAQLYANGTCDVCGKC